MMQEREIVPVKFFEPMQPKILEYMIENMSIDLENGRYLSANIRSRIILDLANRAILPKNVVALCFQVQDILHNLGYTEENFMKQMNKSANRLMLDCPPDSIRKELNQDCDAGYEELKEYKQQGFKCCIKIQKELQKMDADNLEILRDLNDKDVQLYQEFQARFGLAGSAKADRDGLMNHIDDIPAPILKVAQEMVQSENLDTQIKMQTDIKNKDFQKAADRMGISEKLLMYLLQKTGGAIDWFTSHDYSTWFTVVYIFRLITVVLCWIKALYDAGGRIFELIIGLILKALGSSMFTDLKSFVWGVTTFITTSFVRGVVSFFWSQKVLKNNSPLAALINIPTWFYAKFINMISFSLLVGQMILIGISFWTGGAAITTGAGIATSIFSTFSSAFCATNTVNVFEYVGQGYKKLISAFMLFICESSQSSWSPVAIGCNFLPSFITKIDDFSIFKTIIASTVASNAIGVVASATI